MINEDVDLTAFPVLRLDQIKIIDSSILKKAEIELNELIKSSLDDDHADNNSRGNQQMDPPFVKYLRKLVNAITMELTQRLASKRIHDLLHPSIDVNLHDAHSGNDESVREDAKSRNGVTDRTLFKKYVSHDSTSRQDNSNMIINNTIIAANTSNSITNTTNSINDNDIISSDSKISMSAFKPLPLPSQLKRQSSIASKSTMHSTSTNTSMDTMKNDDIRTSLSATAGLMSSRSINGLDDSSNIHHHHINSDTDDNTTQSSSVSIKSTTALGDQPFNSHTRRPQSSNAAATSVCTRPSRKALNVVNENFGKAFIVAGEGKKRRPVVLKKAEESEEDLKARERTDR